MTCIVGHRGRLFKIEDDFQVGESTLPYDACGSGEEFALGAMCVMNGYAPKTMITKALTAATTVAAPFHIIQTIA